MPEEEKKKFADVRLWRDSGETKLSLQTHGWDALMKGMGATRHALSLSGDAFTMTKADGSALGELRYFRYSDDVSKLLNAAASRAEQSDDSLGNVRPRMDQLDRGVYYDGYFNVGLCRIVGADEGLLFHLKQPISDVLAKMYVDATLKFFSEVYAATVRRYDFRGSVSVGVETTAHLAANATATAESETGREVTQVAQS